MEIADIVRQLQELQIKQSELLSQLASKQSQPANTDPKPKDSSKEKPKEVRPARTRNTVEQGLKPGDAITLLTGGIVARKGDRATVTKVTDTAVHFVIDRNGHITYKRHKNVRKIN